MSDRVNFQAKLYSPRWGTQDIYEFEFERDQMKVGKVGNPSFALLSWVENRDPVWSGHMPITHPLLDILHNDHIYPPSIFVWALESLWKAWRSYEINDEQAQEELIALCEWVNTVSKSQPKTQFGRGKF